MENRTVKIYNQIEFQQLVKNIKGLKIAQLADTELSESQLVDNLDNLVVSDSLCCSYCNTKFENKVEQRSHYKLEWHRFNLKQNLHGFDSVTENQFDSLTDKTLLYMADYFDTDSENENLDSLLDDSFENSKLDDGSKKTKSNSKKGNLDEENLKTSKNSKKEPNSYHTKVHFKNDDGSTFSLYRCLLHNKKKPPESDHILVRQALECAKKSLWTIILLGGGHFAAGIFSEGKPVVHKTFHSYTVRAKQGSMQSSRDNRNASSHPKSAGASLRRYSEASLVEHVQKILESWSSLIADSSLILYRAVGPYNRNILFGGKNTPFDKNDNRLRPLPFPTQKPTFTEVERVYDILSSVQVHGSQTEFNKCDSSFSDQSLTETFSTDSNLEGVKSSEVLVNKSSDQAADPSCRRISPNKQNKKLRNQIDRAKSRKSPSRPLPDIVAILAQSSDSETDSENDAEEGSNNFDIREHELQISFKDNLKAFENLPVKRTKKKSQKNKITKK